MKDLSSKLPETKVLEGKLSDMMHLQPSIQKTLIKLNHLTTMPEKSLVESKMSATKAAVKAIEKATDGVSKSSLKALTKSSASSENSSSKEVGKALKKIEKIQGKVDKADKKESKSDTAKEIKAAIKDIADTTSDALAIKSSTVEGEENNVKNLVSSRTCKPGEDEVFDNCVAAPVKREWNDVDQGDIKDNNKNMNNA